MKPLSTKVIVACLLVGAILLISIGLVLWLVVFKDTENNDSTKNNDTVNGNDATDGAGDDTGSDVMKTQNVLLIMADDMRPEAEPFRSSFGWSVSPNDLHTPNLKRLASKGTTFQKAYCQYPICGPSRTSMLTGRRPDTTKVYANEDYWRNQTDITSFPQYLKSKGFTTYGIGKIYHGDYDGVNGGYDSPSWSYDDGYEFYAPLTASRYWKRVYGSTKSHHAVDESNENSDLTDRDIANQAVSSIKKFSQEGTKFFLAVGFKLPHLPWFAPNPFYLNFTGDLPDNEYVPNNLPDDAVYDSNELREYDDIGQLPFTGLMDDESLTSVDSSVTRSLRRAYYASVSYVDSLVGELLDTLDSTGLRENTAIVFTSDHGYSLGEHKMWNKITNYELANHIPLIISSPDQQQSAGTSNEELVELVDLFPTVLDLVGVEQVDKCSSDPVISSGTQICREGMSLVPLLNPQHAWNKDAVFHQVKRTNTMGYSIYRRIDSVLYHFTVWVPFNLKTGVVNWNTRAERGRELYNLEQDPFENDNIEGSNSQLEQQLYDDLYLGWSSYNS